MTENGHPRREKRGRERRQVTYRTMAEETTGSLERAASTLNIGGSGHGLRIEGGRGVQVEDIGDGERGGAIRGHGVASVDGGAG